MLTAFAFFLAQSQFGDTSLEDRVKYRLMYTAVLKGLKYITQDAARKRPSTRRGTSVVLSLNYNMVQHLTNPFFLPNCFRKTHKMQYGKGQIYFTGALYLKYGMVQRFIKSIFLPVRYENV